MDNNNKTYKRGDRFLVNGKEHVLVHIGRTAVLINIDITSPNNGNQWSEPVNVNSMLSISLEEMKQIIKHEEGTIEGIIYYKVHDIVGITRPYPPEKTVLELVEEFSDAFEERVIELADLKIGARLIAIKEAIIREAK